MYACSLLCDLSLQAEHPVIYWTTKLKFWYYFHGAECNQIVLVAKKLSVLQLLLVPPNDCVTKCEESFSFRVKWWVLSWVCRHTPEYCACFLLLFCVAITKKKTNIKLSSIYLCWLPSLVLSQRIQAVWFNIDEKGLLDWPRGPSLTFWKLFLLKCFEALVLDTQVKYDGINFGDGLIMKSKIASAPRRVFRLVR